LKSIWSERYQAYVSSGKQNGPFDGLPLPGGKRVADVSSAELTRILQSVGIPGVSPSQGRDANLSAYAQHFEAIRKQAADNAVAEWLKGKGQ
jgi:hypothetical protein